MADSQFKTEGGDCEAMLEVIESMNAIAMVVRWKVECLL